MRQIAFSCIAALLACGYSANAQDGDAASLSVLTLNLHTYQEIRADGIDETALTAVMAEQRVRDYGAIFDRIAAGIDALDPDIICLQEVGEWAGAPVGDPASIRFGATDSNMVRQILSRLDRRYHSTMDWSHYGWQVWLEGSAILSRYPLSRSGSRFISGPETDRNESWKSRNVPMAAIDVPGIGKVAVYSVHAGWWDDPVEPSREQYSRLFEWVNDPDNAAASVILCGDFNAPADGAAYEFLTADTGFADAYLAANPDGMFDATVSDGADGREGAAGQRIDYVFVNEDAPLRVVHARRVFTAADVGRVSDHVGVYAEFRLRPAAVSLEVLGRLLFYDARLSAGRNQSCATCHDPARVFSDPGANVTGGAVSMGSDGISLGDRNAATLTYAARTPPFRINGDGEFIGGFFLDGRAATLAVQAQEPITNPIEMALPDAQALLDRVRENPFYVEAFGALLGSAALDSPTAALHSVATAIAAFENTAEFAPFDSKYDRYLRGEAELSEAEELGRKLFFSELLNCSRCHLLDRRENRRDEVFTSHLYYNIGVPVNAAARRLNGYGANYRDTGLQQNPAVDDPAQAGRFRVPSLRNVAVTGPYMHNGVFRKLETALVFYNRYLLATDAAQINPETGQPWGAAEVPATIELELLSTGQPLTPAHIASLTAFLETLTDRRYEPLLGR